MPDRQMTDGTWKPAAPTPLFYGWLFWLKGRYGCSCGRRFYRLNTYETHWSAEQGDKDAR
jgi:hypothetical protein